MDALGLVLAIVASIAFIAAFSMTLYAVLPPSLWDEAARHGRFAGLGMSNPPSGRIAGNARVTRPGWRLQPALSASM